MKFTSRFLKINKIAGMLYSTKLKTNALVVYATGAPIPPDSGNLPDAPTIMNYPVDLFVPDYIGYGRSDGIFTPKNCIKTFLYLYSSLKKGVVAMNYYENSKIKLQYKRIIFIGRSLGGAYIPLLPRFNKNITELAIFYGAVDQSEQGKIPKEETNEDFMRSMTKDGYHYIYRGILRKTWWNHLNDRDGLSPMENIIYLKNARLFIAHGKEDACINYSKSVRYYEKIIKFFPNKKIDFKLKIYNKGRHDFTTSTRGIKDFFSWIKLNKIS